MSSSAPQKSISQLLQTPKFGTGIGLHRVDWILRRIHETSSGFIFDAIKVTGSNGKGSTCAFLSAILTELGVKNGLYTSPHLVSFHERIKIDGVDISDDDLQAAVAWFENTQREYHREFPKDVIGAFEAFTGIALYSFAQQHVKTVILEAGLGGRYDSTRVVPGDLVALTSLDLEHTELLGETLEEIAYNKIDLCREGNVLVLGQIHDPDLLRRIRAYCELKGLRLIVAHEECRIERVEYSEAEMSLDIHFEGNCFRNIRVNLVGPHQLSNACVAIVLAWQWCRRNTPNVSLSVFERSLRKGLSKAVWQGRFEKIHSEPDIYIDVGHSPDAIDACLQTVNLVLKDRKIVLVTGVSYNKNVKEIVSRLVTVADEIICTRAYHKGADVSQIETIAKKICPSIPCHRGETIEEAMSLAVSHAQKQEMTVLVAGGLFLAIEAQQVVSGKDPGALQFF